MYDSNNSQIGVNDDGGSALNFRLSCYLTANQTYYIKIETHSNNIGYFNMVIVDKAFIESIEIDDLYVELTKGQSTRLTATVSPSYATNQTLRWDTSDSNIVSVNANTGEITAVNGGTAMVCAYSQDGSQKSCCCQVTVNVPVESVTVNTETKLMQVGESDSLSVTVLPEDASDKLVYWTSSNNDVAVISSATGRVTAKGVGTANIYATAEDGSGKQGVCVLTVEPPIAVQGIDFCSDNYTMNVGETTYLSYDIHPSNATNKSVVWCSSNPNVAEINASSGRITAKMAGTTTITVITNDGSFVTSCTVKVISLLIYQTRDTEVKWFDPEVENASETIRPDLYYDCMTKSEIVDKVSCIDSSNFKKYVVTHHDGSGEYFPRTISDYRDSFMNMCKTYFANDEFDHVVEDMIEHFMGEIDVNFDGTINGYSIYKNSDLTEKVIEHAESKNYVNNIKETLDSCLKDSEGNISVLEYEPSTRFLPTERGLLPFVAKANKLDYNQPCFDSISDTTEGFTICLDSLHGNKVEVISYILNGNTYSGTMKFTYYDHFGLDLKDMTGNYGFKSLAISTLTGFKDWFILQHCNELGVIPHPKPFVTIIEFEVPFSGQI